MAAPIRAAHLLTTANSSATFGRAAPPRLQGRRVLRPLRVGPSKAKRRFQRKEMECWLHERGVILSGVDLDESPMAYRRLPKVRAEHAGLIKVTRTLRPFAVAMAGAGEVDPCKD